MKPLHPIMRRCRVAACAVQRCSQPLARRIRRRAPQASMHGCGLSPFFHEGGTSSATNSWICGEPAHKSLIAERIAAMSNREIAISRTFFAMSPSLSSAGTPTPTFLSISLKKKKKESERDGRTNRNSAPRVAAVLPLVATTACFSGHGFSSAATNE